MDFLDKLTSDTLWIYTGILGSVFGALFVAYMKDTRIGIAVYSKWDYFLDKIRDRFGITCLEQDNNAWRKKYPHITKKIDELDDRLHKLEKKN